MEIQLQDNTDNKSGGDGASGTSSSLSGNLLPISYMFININCIFINISHIHKIAKKWPLSLSGLPVCPSIHPSARMEQFGCQPMDFHEFWYLNVFWKSVKKFKISLNLTIIMGATHETLYTFMKSCWILITLRNILDRISRENKKNAFFVQWLFPENHVIHEIIWMNVIEGHKPQMTT